MVVESQIDGDVSRAVEVGVWCCGTTVVCEVAIATVQVPPVSEWRESVLSKVGVVRGPRVLGKEVSPDCILPRVSREEVSR